jgi:tRNA 2-selenouridine synthase
MTLPSESSESGPGQAAYGPIESLAGLFHPHAIEIQDFGYYSLILDVRPASEYEDDHIPGAVRLDPDAWPELSLTTGSNAMLAPPLAAREPSMDDLPPPLAAAVANVKLDQAILVYCGRGGLVSTPVAQALRWRGWTADVLPGGWINYRRWVKAGLEVLPRLVQFRVIACTLGSEAERVLQALKVTGHQVLDLEGIAVARRFALTKSGPGQPAQAWFDSLLLQSLRAFDPALPVWTGDVGPRVGAIALPGALIDALSIAPAASLQVEVVPRAAAWAEDEPLCSDGAALVKAVAAHVGPESGAAIEPWRELASHEPARPILSSVLQVFLDTAYRQERRTRSERQHELPALRTGSLSPAALADAVRQWMPMPPSKLP